MTAKDAMERATLASLVFWHGGAWWLRVIDLAEGTAVDRECEDGVAAWRALGEYRLEAAAAMLGLEGVALPAGVGGWDEAIVALDTMVTRGTRS